MIRVRSSILFQHENNLNGKNPGDQEWFPFDKKTQHFPAEDPDQPERTTYLHFEGDPRSPYGGTGLVWGKFEMCVAPQHFAPKDPRSESQLWPWHDQGGGFFGEIKKSDDGRDWLSYPNGQIEGREAPWFMPQGTHSLQASKYISWAAIFTGSNGIERAPWINRLFLQEELEFDAPYWSQLMHFVTITEDAQGAHEKALVYDEHTFYDQESKSLASIIETINMGDRQRRRWGAMVGYFLSFAFKYLRDEIIRCRLFGILAKIPVLGIPFERARIPHVYTREQIHEWINTGTFFLDALIKYIFALTPALYIFLGFTPLPATITFIAAWLYKTMTGWPAYGYQTAKWGVSPRRTIFPFPRNIFYWYFYLPNIFRGMLHNEDEDIGAFAPTFQTRGANITSSAKKQIFWVFTALPTASAVYGLIKFYSLAFLFKTGALAAIGSSLWPLGLAIGASIIFHKLINKIWPGERTKFYQSAIKFLVPFGSILGTAIYSVAALSAAAFPGSFLLGLFMNTVWAGYMGAGALWSWWRYLKDQALIAENTDNQKVDRLKNVLREISFWDVFARDKRRMFQRGL